LLKEKQRRNLELFREEYPDPMKMNPSAMYHFGVCYEILGDYENALVWLKNALEKSRKERYDEFTILIPQNIAQILERLGKTDEAMDYLNQSLNADPYFEPSISQKAQLLFKLGQTEEAVKWFGYAASLVQKVGLSPSNIAQVHVNSLQFLAEYWNRNGQTQLAIDILKTLKNLMLGTPHNPFALAEIYVAKDKAAEALDNLEFLKKELGSKPEFAFLYGQALALSGKVQEAVQIVSKAKAKFPQNSDIAELAKAMEI
jgi:tetratricopeptide (TPR) repeat protein